MLQWSYYTYWSDLPVDGFEIVIRPDRGWAAVPTNDGLTMLVVGWPYAEAAAYKADVEGNYLQDARAGAGVRRAGARRDPRGAVRRRRRAQLLPQAVRARAGRWSATPATTRTRSPRRASATPSATPSRAPPRSTTCSAAARPFDDAMADYQRARDDARAADLRVHDPAGHARAAAARDAAAARRRPRQPGGDGRVRQHHRRHGVAGTSSTPPTSAAHGCGPLNGTRTRNGAAPKRRPVSGYCRSAGSAREAGHGVRHLLRALGDCLGVLGGEVSGVGAQLAAAG